MKPLRIVLSLLIAQGFCSLGVLSICGQRETVDIMEYTPPSGWTKTLKQGTTIYAGSDQATGGFCILTVYPSAISGGNAQKDFSNEWNDLIVKPFKATSNPKSQTQTVDGWTSVSGATQIESDGVKSAVLVTVISGYGRKATVFAILNNQEFYPQVDAFMTSIKMDKAKAQTTGKSPSSPPSADKSTGQIASDPFPDKPGFQPQQPLAGRLKGSVTLADLAGTWDLGGASVVSYVNSSNGTYAGTDTTFTIEAYTINPDGTFEQRFAGRSGNHTTREVSTGKITLSGGNIVVQFTGGERRAPYKYQFISYMVLPNGGAVLSLIHIADNDPGYTPSALVQICGHAHGYITCSGGDEWTLRPHSK
ncbi:MAG TPA: hypothetical protein VGO43_04840 [Pyrinomonadaceae bacterium]|jgi:hypothetical protein|nr:hypothetical protein [Pyrinomonadaceae bacterium]